MLVLGPAWSRCFFLMCCSSLGLLAYCLWQRSQLCGWLVTLPTVCENVEASRPSEPAGEINILCGQTDKFL